SRQKLLLLLMLISCVASVCSQTGKKVGFFSFGSCPHGWWADGRSCYSVRRSGRSWSDAQTRCSDLTAGGHLAALKTPEDLLFVSSHLLTDDDLLLLWTGLNDQQVVYSNHFILNVCS
uniref:C-type lectin domain-containing protein n=1 Tax=Kryptolebias marmoratus TaxID=37003 RepID=A0A3Q3AT54_KRYMA